MRIILGAALAAGLTAGCVFTAAPAARAAPEPPADTASCPSADLAGCYRWEQMQEFAETGARMVTDYLKAIGISPESLPALTFVASGRTAHSQCVDVNGNEVQNDRSNDYCPTDNAVFIGQNTLGESYRQYGQAAPISGLAHEYGHFLQSVMQVPSPGSATETIRHEDQADCFSGAFMGFLRDRGSIEYPEDVDAVERYLAATASDDAPGRDHGTARERIESFSLGYTGGLPMCSRFFPATPLTR